MGLFGRTKPAPPPEPSRAEPTPAVDPAALGLADLYPSATPDQPEMMTTIAVTLVQKQGGGTFTPMQVAAISTACERLVAANPDLERFVESLRKIASAERAAGARDTSWRWLATEL